MNQLDREEREILESYERGEWKPIEDLEAEMERYREYARATLEQDCSVSVPISSNDLDAIQKLAVEEGVPFQSLISTIVHNYLASRSLENGASTRPTTTTKPSNGDPHD